LDTFAQESVSEGPTSMADATLWYGSPYHAQSLDAAYFGRYASQICMFPWVVSCHLFLAGTIGSDRSQPISDSPQQLVPGTLVARSSTAITGLASTLQTTKDTVEDIDGY
jgi:hypothetical protein